MAPSEKSSNMYIKTLEKVQREPLSMAPPKNQVICPLQQPRKSKRSHQLWHTLKIK